MNPTKATGPSGQRPLKILILSQVYHPDVVAVAQHLSDFAVELAERGHRVRVIASRRAYDDPSVRFSARETHRGVEVVRVHGTGFGKRAKWRRALDFVSFISSCCLRLLVEPKPDVVVALTAPPLISFVGAFFARWKRVRFFYWVMDLNPDEAVAAGWLRAGSPAERILQRLSQYSLEHADRIIALDRFMCERLLSKGVAREKIAVIPPWSHDDLVRFSEVGRQEFRRQHGLSDKFVVMYSGNHSPCHPLTTVLEAARVLAADSSFVFCFVGGGSEFPKVKQFATENRLSNVVCLPYQPLEKLATSLSAADLQVVVMGNEFVGMIHPCKIYNILAMGIPFVYIGPEPSHVADILDEIGPDLATTRVAHGQVDLLVSHLKQLRIAGDSGHNDRRFSELAGRFGCGTLVPRLVEAIESLGPGDSSPTDGGGGRRQQ